LKQIKALVTDGVIEITLLGQNVNSYRDDGIDFPELLKKAASDTDIQRIRFMTSHPKDMSDRLVEMIKSEPKMMSHVHLPLQSGSDYRDDQVGAEDDEPCAPAAAIGLRPDSQDDGT